MAYDAPIEYNDHLEEILEMEQGSQFRAESKASKIYIYGRYRKFSRNLPQTPMNYIPRSKTHNISNERVGEDEMSGLVNNSRSVQSLICHPLCVAIGASPDKCTLSGSGREDVDVRMLGKGRPFCLQICDPLLSIEKLVEHHPKNQPPKPIIPSINNEQPLEPNRHSEILGSESELLDDNVMQFLGRKLDQSFCVFNDEVQVTFLYETDKRMLGYLSYTASRHTKTYECKVTIWDISNSLTMNDEKRGDISTDFGLSIEPKNVRTHLPLFIERLNSLQNINIQQRTPLRVSHRRSISTRQKIIYRLFCSRINHHKNVACTMKNAEDGTEHVLSDNMMSGIQTKLDANHHIAPHKENDPNGRNVECFKLLIECSAGMYVKEFVHGDLGRTFPSFADLVNDQLNTEGVSTSSHPQIVDADIEELDVIDITEH